LTAALYEFPKLVEILGNTAKEYAKMTEEEKDKLIWTGTKALIAGAVKYNVKKSMPSIFSLFLENSPWHSVVDCVANVLKKYGEGKTAHEVIEKAASDVEAYLKEGEKNSPVS